MENIGIYSFYGCSNLNGCLVIPDGIQCIGENSFAYTGFTSLTFNGTMEPKCDRPIFEEGKFIELSLSSDYKNTSFCFVNEEINTNTIESITLPTNESSLTFSSSEVILSTIITDISISTSFTAYSDINTIAASFDTTYNGDDGSCSDSDKNGKKKIGSVQIVCIVVGCVVVVAVIIICVILIIRYRKANQGLWKLQDSSSSLLNTDNRINLI